MSVGSVLVVIAVAYLIWFVVLAIAVWLLGE
jgi:hypothetical protein